MRTNLLMTAAGLGLCLLGSGLRAQDGTTHATDGGTRQTIQSVDILPTEGASFTATVVTEWTRLLPDGSTGTIKNHRMVARDSAGRVFQERRFFSPTGDQQVTALSELDYEDPTRHEMYVCHPASKVCEVYRSGRPTQVVPPLARQLPNGRGTVTEEALGMKTIESLDVVGSREVTTLSAGVMGDQKAEPTVKEFWYSPRLQVNVVTKRFDPHASAIQDIELRTINLNEPDPKLFVPPTEYRVIRMNTP